jgi:hypothetical protein
MPDQTDAHARLATEAYIYGYPFVYNLSEMIKGTTQPDTALGAPVNLFSHASKLADPQDHFVSLNNDTLYSVAGCDVTREPLVLHVPGTHDRYYVMQFVDAWTNNFAYVGRRATGTAEAAYLLAGPGWQGAVPAGLPRIHTPSTVFAVVGRFAVAGAADVPAVAELQRQTWLTPLSRYPAPPATQGRQLGDWPLAPWDQDVPEDLRFWEQVRAWMRLFPPPQRDHDFVRTLAPLGLLEPHSPYRAAPSALVAALRTGAQEGQETIERVTRAGQGAPVNGWLSALHSFDYNLDYLGPGTIDSPAWKIAERQQSYLVRAASARGGLWGNHGYEAAYAWSYVDDQGEQLNGTRRYAIHFAQTPPVDAFWSLTMYDMPQYYLVANPLHRYSIGDRTPGLHYNPDGSLDLVLQHERPGAEQEANWLPAPAGDFRPLVRMYQPRAPVLNGSYQLPPIRRLALA